MKYKKLKCRTKYLSEEYRAGVIRLAKEMGDLLTEIRKERAELDLPSDMNDPEQMMIYLQIDELLTALDSTDLKATQAGNEGGREND